MLKIIITGKPSRFTTIKKVEGSKVSARFILEEKRWTGGKVEIINWEICVPEHKQTWASAQVEKGYSVWVEGSDVFFRTDVIDGKTYVTPMLMLDEIRGL